MIIKTIFLLLIVSSISYGQESNLSVGAKAEAQVKIEKAKSEKVDYFLEVSSLNSLVPKIRDYLVLLEIKKNKKLLPKKKMVEALYTKYVSDDQIKAVLVEEVSSQFSKQEINKLIAIFETKEMKKFFSLQGTFIKLSLGKLQPNLAPEITNEVQMLLK